MRIECAYSKLVSVNDLIEHPCNRNKHPQKQIEVLAKIIAKVGQRSPIVVSNQTNYVTKGNGRLAAIKLLGWDQCAVDYQNYANELEEFNDRIADNEVARYAEFDKMGMLDDIDARDLKIDDLDMEEFGLIDFKLPLVDFMDTQEESGGDDLSSEDENKKFILQVTLPNELELRDLYDDLISKGYIVREM